MSLAPFSSPDSGDRKMARSHQPSPVPPDGGWGWVVVMSSFLIHVIADGVAYSFGIFYIEFLHVFGESRGATGWVGSLMVGTTWTSGKHIVQG